MKDVLKGLGSVQLKQGPPPIVRHSFFVVDTTPDPKPAWVIPNRLALGSQDCAFASDTRDGFTHIVNVGYDIPNAFEAEGKIKYLKVNVFDLGEFSLLDVIEQSSAFIDEALAEPEGKVLVHCQAGVSRSASVVAAYLMLVRARGGRFATFEEVLQEIRQVRPSANPNVGFQAQLKEYEKILLSRYACARPNASSSSSTNGNKQKTSVEPPLRVRFMRFLGQLNFVYHLLRPLGAFLSSTIVISRLIFKQKLNKQLLFFSLFLLAGLVRDDVFRATLVGRLSVARPGLFYRPSIRKLVQQLPCVTQEYKLQLWLRLLGADFTTISFLAAGYKPQLIPFRREQVREACLHSGGSFERQFSLDWAFPPNPFLAQECVVILCGIGGDSNSAYVRSVTEKLNQDGIVVVVLLARGLGICSHGGADLERLYNPTDDGDVHHVVLKLSKLYRRVGVMGFSLGGITVCRYFSRFADSIPENVKGCFSVSGGFRVGFITNPRYENVYQRLLVPSLVDDVIAKYGHELRRRVGSVMPVLTSSSYRDLHRELYIRTGLPRVEEDFDRWCEILGACPSKVTKPLLLLTALDDPLHHPEMLGLNKLWDDTAEDPEVSENVIVICTDGGGHVAWPEDGFSSKGYTYLQRLASDFFRAVFHKNG